MIIIPRLQAAKYKKSLFQSLAFKRWFFLTNAFYFKPLQVFHPPGKRFRKLAERDRGLGFLLLTIRQSFAGLLCGRSTSRASVFLLSPPTMRRESLTDSENLQREYGLVVFLNGIVSSDVSQQIVQVEGTRFLNQELPKPFLL